MMNKITQDNRGFTLIELIMVIVILGILSAVVIPRFFSLEIKAHHKVEKGVIGNIKAGLLTYTVNSLAHDGKREYPAANATNLLTDVLDEVPEGWTWTAGGSASGTGLITYTARGDSNITWDYTRSGSSSNRLYTLANRHGDTK